MGYSLSWAAVRGRSAEAVRAELGLRPTGRTLEVPEGAFCSALLDTGWFVVLADHGARFEDQAVLATLSAGGEVVACFVEEHVMASAASGWRDGKLEWSVGHQAEASLDHLDRQGRPPPALAELEAAARAKRQARAEGPDFLFDVPVDLAKAVTGFRHDEGERPFEELEPSAAPPKKGWLQRVLGR